MTRRVRFTPLLRAGVFAGAAVLAAAPARAANVPFVTQPPVTTSASGAYSGALADVDGDGDLDALSASGYDDKIAWYENAAGDGTSWVLRTITTSADGAPSVHAADVDGDGDIDAVSASVYDDKIAWYENTAGNGTAWTLRTIALTADGPRDVWAADVDGDGDTDALSVSRNDDKVAWYENMLGDGSAWTPRTISTAADGGWSVAAADVDGDGDQDVLSASINDDEIAWYENTAGNGTTWTLLTISTAADGAVAVSAADVDRDGDIDVLSASVYDDTIAWYENTAGNGTAWSERVVSTAVDGAFSVTAADLDADGDPDVLVTAAFADAVRWYENTAGNGTAWTARTVATAATPVAIVAGDVDGDGDIDALSAAFTANTVAWHRNDTIHETACFVTRPPLSTLDGGAYQTLVADLDGDGDRDVIASSAGSDRVVWYRNASGAGDSWVLHTIATADRPTGVDSADIDGDGDLDVLSVADQDDTVSWHSNVSGDGTIWLTRTVSAQPRFSPLYAVAAGDVDGDGDQDVISSVGRAGQVAWFENTLGNGTAWTTHTMDVVTDFLRFVRPADVDGDGDLDVLWASSYDDKVAWYDNTAGNGTAWVRRTISTAAIGASSVMPADVDGDGDLDAVAASFIDDKVAWHENADGIGQAWVEHTIVTTADPFSSIFPAELDRDGDTDILSVSGKGGNPAWLENTGGDGSAWAPHVLSTLTLEAAFMGTGDLDGDGDFDAVTASAAAVAPVVWYANGAGQVVTTVSDLAPPGAENGDVVPMLGIVVTHGGRPGDGDLELARLGLLFEEQPGDPLTTAEANALIESLRIYRDADDNGLFDPGTDALVTSVATLALAGGVQVVDFADGDPNVRVAHGSPRRYFVVTEITANANTQTPNRFRVTHLGLGPSASVAEDRTYDIPLRPACPADTASSVLAPTPVELMDFRIE